MNCGVLLIFDEVVTGFRLAYGGAQEYYGVVPDLVAYGKALGGGYPIGAFGGRRDVMDLVNEHRIGSDALCLDGLDPGRQSDLDRGGERGAVGVLRQPGTYEHLHGLGNKFREMLRKLLRDRAGHRAGDRRRAAGADRVQRLQGERLSLDRARRQGRAREMMLGLFARGVFINPMGTKLYLSLAHDEAVCDAFCRRLDETLEEIR